MPSYLALFRQGILQERARGVMASLECCALCPRCCGTNRQLSVGAGCRTGARAVVSSSHPHFGEEAPLVGRRGSGTIFFASCNLGCVFCQNWATSRGFDAREVTSAELAGMMLELQGAGCHNINLVTPSHMVASILAALVEAIPLGLGLPIVYNTSGYDRVDTLRLLDGVVDIYMPDMKFMNAEAAARYAGAPDYPDIARAAVREMHRQVGDLVLDEAGVAVRGLLVRHLVMPGGVADAREVCRFLAREISVNTYLNLMGQYRPGGQARRYFEIARRPTPAELAEAVRAAGDEGLRRLDGSGS